MYALAIAVVVLAVILGAWGSAIISRLDTLIDLANRPYAQAIERERREAERAGR